MGPLLHVGAVNALAAGLLALAAVAAGRWSRRPALVHGLWVLVLLKLITPPVIPLPLLVPDEEPAPLPALPAPPERTVVLVSDPAPDLPAPAPRRFQNFDELKAAAQGVEAPLPPAEQEPGVGVPASAGPQQENRLQPVLQPVAETVPAPFATQLPPPTAEPWQRFPLTGASGLWPALPLVLGILWLGGAAVWFVLTGRRIACFHRLLRCATPASAALQDEVRELARRMGLRCCPSIWLLPGPVPPLVWAVGGRARLFFPRNLLQRLAPQSRAALLVHELAHIRRRDHWVRALEWVVAGLYWWYPLVWYACRRLHAAEEECCDAWVTSELPEAGTAYAGALLETVDFLAEAPAVAVLPPAASGFGRTYFIKRRLTLIMGSGPPRSLSLSGRVVLLGLALVLLPLGLTRARPAPGSAAGPPAANRRTAVPAVLPAAEEPLTYGAPSAILRRGVEEGKTPPETAFPLLCLACSPDGKTLAAGGEEKEVLLLDAVTGRLLRRLEGHDDAVSSLAFSPDGSMLATASFDHTVRLWDLVHGRPRAVLAGHNNWVFAVAFSPDGRTLASAGYDKAVRLWDPDTGQELAVLAGHKGGVRCLAFAPDGRTLASGSADQAVRIWDLDTRTLATVCKGHEGIVRTVSFAPDGRTVVSGGEDNILRLWDPASGRQTATHAHGDMVLAASFSPRGRSLVSAGADNLVRVLDPAGAQPRARLSGHTDAATCVAFSPDGKVLYTGGTDGTVRRWPASPPRK